MSGISSRQGSHQVAHTFTSTARAPGLLTAARISSMPAGAMEALAAAGLPAAGGPPTARHTPAARPQASSKARLHEVDMALPSGAQPRGRAPPTLGGT